jgi:hypothetical protein
MPFTVCQFVVDFIIVGMSLHNRGVLCLLGGIFVLMSGVKDERDFEETGGEKL